MSLLWPEHRKVIALVEPGPSPAAEREFHEFSHEKAEILTTRVLFDRMTDGGLSDMIERLPNTIQTIVGARPEIIALNSFTGSCLKGTEMVNMVQQLTGALAIAPAPEMARCLHLLGARRIALVSAFGTDFNMLERIYFSSQNIDIAPLISISFEADRFRAEDPYLISRIPPSIIMERVRAADLSGADALVLDSPTFALKEVIKELSAFVKIPILSANQVMLYSALSHIGAPTDHLLISPYLGKLSFAHKK